ncbi:tRNA pseudouridine synthase A [hydrothermal vent metagenome]|uniref:tRNA pseudouridine synthase A n=1 Tax=hydrothermal vent metagenome TaxID=652676 RepID=A0A3B0ZPB1_9ZZZZ
MKEPIRLSKRLIELIRCSRSEAERYIEGGWVLVDGEIIDQPQLKILNERVELHPEATLAPCPPVTILLHQATGFEIDAPTAALPLITPENHSSDDKSGIRILKRHFARLKATAPLEARATGLVVYSQDGRVVRRLVDDANKNEQEYLVKVSGEIAASGLAKLNRPMKMDGWKLPAAKVSWQNEVRLRFALKNVRPEQIEFMCHSVGLKVDTMLRLRIGRVSLSKLPPGQWRYLPNGTLF